MPCTSRASLTTTMDITLIGSGLDVVCISLKFILLVTIKENNFSTILIIDKPEHIVIAFLVEFFYGFKSH
jgi:hypothetical protein